METNDLQDLVTTYGIAPEWEPEFSTSKSIAEKPPLGMMDVYAEYLYTGYLRFSITKFSCNILMGHEIHLPQVHPFGLMRIRHFEFCCPANNIMSTVEKFVVFYKMNGRGGWYNCAVTRKGMTSNETPRSAYD